jgi:hypothetical protein
MPIQQVQLTDTFDAWRQKTNQAITDINNTARADLSNVSLTALNSKLAENTITEMTLGDLTISGDLTVEGEVVTVNKSTLDLEDAEITLNAGLTTAPSTDGIIRVNRGSEADATITFDETNDVWKMSNAVATGGADLSDVASTITPDLSAGNIFEITLDGNKTFANPSNLVPYTIYTFIVKQDATGSRTITWGSVYQWANGTAPALTTGANAVDIVTFISDGTNLFGTYIRDVR